MKLTTVLALSGFVAILGSLFFIFILLVSYDDNGSAILISLLVMLNGIIALGVSEILNKLNQST